jgi:hypothetical protein
MKPTIRKVKTVRGRLEGYKATFGPVESGTRKTPKEAALSCEHEALSALGRLDRGTRVLRWRGHTAVIMPTISGWSYWIDTASRSDIIQGTSSTDREGAENAALHHLAQNVWTPEVADDEAFLRAEPSADECGLPYIVRDVLRPWFNFQRAYVALRKDGYSDVEAHRLAGEARSA